MLLGRPLYTINTRNLVLKYPTLPTALAAPVEDGIIFWAAPRPPLQSYNMIGDGMLKFGIPNQCNNENFSLGTMYDVRTCTVRKGNQIKYLTKI